MFGEILAFGDACVGELKVGYEPSLGSSRTFDTLENTTRHLQEMPRVLCLSISILTPNPNIQGIPEVVYLPVRMFETRWSF